MLCPSNGVVYATTPDGYLTYHEGAFVVMVGDKVIRKLSETEARKTARESPNLTQMGRTVFYL